MHYITQEHYTPDHEAYAMTTLNFHGEEVAVFMDECPNSNPFEGMKDLIIDWQTPYFEDEDIVVIGAIAHTKQNKTKQRCVIAHTTDFRFAGYAFV